MKSPSVAPFALTSWLLAALICAGCVEVPCDLAGSWAGCHVLEDPVSLNPECPSAPRVVFERSEPGALRAEVEVGSERYSVPCAYDVRVRTTLGLQARAVCEDEVTGRELQIDLRDVREMDPGVWRADSGQLHVYAEGYDCHAYAEPAWAY